MSIRFLDLARLHDSVRNELDAAYDTVLKCSGFVGASAVASFEESFGSAHGLPPGVACGSGTDAIALALRAAGVGPGDEVVVPSMTFVATAEAVVHVGATPVLADVDPTTLLITETNVDAVRTERTKAVVAVHLYGHVVPFATLRAWRDAGLLVIEDAAQAHIATDGAEFVGSAGNAACFSFFPGKNLGALGDGGMVLSQDPDLVAEVKRLRDHGRATKYRHDEIGWCSRLDGLQAAFLEVKLRHLATWTEQRRARAADYRELVGDWLVPWEEGAVHHLVVARVPPPRRVRLQEELSRVGIESGIHYPLALSQQPSLRPWSRATPAAEQAATEVLSLPIDPLMSRRDVRDVCQVVAALLE